MVEGQIPLVLDSVQLLDASVEGHKITLNFSATLLYATTSESELEQVLHRVLLQVGEALLTEVTDSEYVVLVDGVPLQRATDSTLPLIEAPPRMPERSNSSVLGVASKKIAINPGHGWYWSGTAWALQRSYYWGIVEDFVNADLAIYVKDRLLTAGATPLPVRNPNKSAGVGESGHNKWEEAARYYVKSLGVPSSVWTVGTGDLNQDIDTRPLYANYANADILVSIHNNGGGGSGTEVWYDTSNCCVADSLRLANALHQEIITTIRSQYNSAWVDRGVKGANANYGENHWATRPSALIELAFMDKASPDNQALQNETFKGLVADAIKRGLDTYFGGATTTETLSVYSKLDGVASSGVSLSLSPSDKNGLTHLVTPSTPANYATYNSNQSVTITAPLSLTGGAQFVGWEAVCQSQNANNCTVTMDGDRGVTALYTSSSCYTLSTVATPQGSGSVLVNTPHNCTGGYTTLSQINLVANPATGYTFTGWSAPFGFFSSTTSQTTYTLVSSVQVTATFSANPVACAYSISPSSAPGVGSGGNGNVQVTGSPSGCTGSWSASASSSGGWLTLTGTTNSSGSGTWQVPYSYPLNPSTTSSRAGTVSFTGSFPSGGTFTLTQSPSTAGGCSYSISPGSSTAPASSGSGSVQVTGSPSGCTGSWSSSASSTGGWLSLTGTTSGSGAGSFQVPYSYGSNPSTTSTRVGTISFSGSLSATFTLTQDAAVGGGGTDLIIDGGFESATSSGFVAPGWAITASPGSNHWLIIKNGPYGHAGVTYGSLGGENVTQYDWLMQTVTIPSNATAPNLTAWINVTTQEMLGDNNVYDVLWVALYDLNGNPITTLRQLSNQDAVLSNNTLGNYFQVGPFDLSAYKGSTVQVAFVALTDSTLPTTFLIDDVSLQVSTVTDNPPTTSITAPANGATVSGTVNVAASASDDIGVTSLEIDIDGVAKASNTNSTSLNYSWNTALVSNGQHQIYSKAYDGAGHVTTSSIVIVTVSNAAALVVTKSGTGGGGVTSNPSGIDCGTTCQFNFAFNTQVTLTATAAGGSSFSGWSGACAGLSPQCTVTMSQARNVTATFDQPPVATGFYVLTPCRLIDTRNANGPYGGPSLNANTTRNVAVAGVCSIPGGINALSVNIASTGAGSNGWLTLFPGPIGASMPFVSTINYSSGKTLANNAVVRVGNDGTINIYNSGPAGVHCIVDVNGYFK